MFVFGNLFNALAMLLDFVFQGLMLVLLVNALLSWVRPDPSNPIVMFLDRVSDVVCDPIRRLFPTVFGGLDVAPLIAMVAIQFIGRSFLVAVLKELALRLG